MLRWRVEISSKDGYFWTDFLLGWTPIVYNATRYKDHFNLLHNCTLLDLQSERRPIKAWTRWQEPVMINTIKEKTYAKLPFFISFEILLFCGLQLALIACFQLTVFKQKFSAFSCGLVEVYKTTCILIYFSCLLMQSETLKFRKTQLICNIQSWIWQSFTGVR